MANQVRVGVSVPGVGRASSDLDRLRDKFDKLQKQGAKGFAIGAGAAVTAKGLSLLDSAAHAVIGVLGDATEAAIAEEESLAKLDAALRANVTGWDGNTKAIEDTLRSRMRLGFSDDEQRQSLALLVVATNDETKALDMQRVAMDLARLKGISLASASEALTKVEGGQFRMLKALGIQLEKGATATDALAAVQKAAQGQAESYAETNRGKLLVSQVKVGEAMEKFGAVTMPIVVAGLTAVADATEGLAGDFERLADNTAKEFDAIGMAVEHAADFMTPWDGALTWSERETKRKTAEMAEYTRSMAAAFREHGAEAGDMATDIVTSFDRAARGALLATNRMIAEIGASLISGQDDIEAAASALAEASIDPIAGPARAAYLANILEGEGSVGKRLAAGMASSDPLVREAAAKLRRAIELQLSGIKISIDLSPNRLTPVNVGGKKLPGFASGGMVPGPIGAPTLAVVHGGEKVTPPGGMGSDGAILAALNVQTGYLAQIAADQPMAATPMTARGSLARQSAMMPGGRL